jgi:hypothetical protein
VKTRWVNIEGGERFSKDEWILYHFESKTD